MRWLITPSAACSTYSTSTPSWCIAGKRRQLAILRLTRRQLNQRRKRHHLAAVLICDACPDAHGAPVGLAARMPQLDDLTMRGQHIAGPHRMQPAQFIHTDAERLRPAPGISLDIVV